MPSPTRLEIQGMVLGATQDYLTRTTNDLHVLAEALARRWPALGRSATNALLRDALLDLVERRLVTVVGYDHAEGGGLHKGDVRDAMQSLAAFAPPKEAGRDFEVLATDDGNGAWERGEFRQPAWLRSTFTHTFLDWSPAAQISVLGDAPPDARIEVHRQPELQIWANAAGWAHLARICAELAAQEFDEGCHWHLPDEDQAFEGDAFILNPTL